MARIQKGYGLDHAYRFFTKRKSVEIDKNEYKDICRDFNKMIVADITKGRTQKIPFSLGYFWIKKFKINYDKPPIDFNETKKKGKLVYHLNHDTDGFRCKWLWTKKNNLIANLIYYSFKPTWSNSQAVSKAFRELGHEKFFTYQVF